MGATPVSILSASGSVLLSAGSGPAAEKYRKQMVQLSARLKDAFPDRFPAAKKTLDDDITWMTTNAKGKKK